MLRAGLTFWLTLFNPDSKPVVWPPSVCLLICAVRNGSEAGRSQVCQRSLCQKVEEQEFESSCVWLCGLRSLECLWRSTVQYRWHLEAGWGRWERLEELETEWKKDESLLQKDHDLNAWRKAAPHTCLHSLKVRCKYPFHAFIPADNSVVFFVGEKFPPEPSALIWHSAAALDPLSLCSAPHVVLCWVIPGFGGACSYPPIPPRARMSGE